ncbi:MAG TPA: GAF domain-containing protein, partial [Candidatus Udaeobacter sp.]|nr:GAF domain-containing protein [Candidatus Udaeobacter sp.]
MKSTKKGSQKSSREKQSRPVQKKPATTKNLSQLVRENETLRRELAESQLEKNATAKQLQERDAELREALEQQTATSEILSVISSSPADVQPVFDTIVKNATRLCESSGATVVRYDGELFYLVAQYNISAENRDAMRRMFPRPPTREFAMTRAVLDSTMVHIADVRQDAEYRQDSVRAAEIRAVLAVPLLRDARPIGAIGVNRSYPGPYAESQIALLKTFADQAVIAIENVRLFKEIQERNAELREALEHQTATAEVLGIISRSPTDVQPVLDVIVESAARVCGIDDVLMRLRDGNSMVARAHFGPIPIGRSEVSVDAPPFVRLREHGTFHIPDTHALQDDLPLFVPPSTGWRTWLAVPLRMQGEFIGSLGARRIEVCPFTPAQIKLLETFAAQAVVAIENVRLFNELKESLEQQTATSEILAVIASSPTDVQPVLDTVAKNAARLCGATDAQIRLIDGDGTRLVASFGEVPAREFVPISPRHPVGRAILNKETVQVDDVVEARKTEFPDFLNATLGTRTFLSTPMLKEGTAIGVINIRRTEVRPFSDRQIKLLETFAAQAVIAIENVRLFKEIQERNAELREALEHQTATAEVLGIISRSPTDVQPVLDAIAESAGRVCGIDDVHLRLREGNTMVLRAHFGPAPLGRIEISIDEPRYRWMREHGTVHIPDVRAQNNFPSFGSLSGLRTFLAVPLRQQGELIGTLSGRRTEVRPFTLAQIRLLETFADQAVIALENVRLFQELKESLEQQTATSEILGVIASSPTDIQPVLDTVAEHAARLCDSVDAQIISAEGNRIIPVATYGTLFPDQKNVVESNNGIALSRGSPAGRAVLDRQTLHIHDLATEIETEFPEIAEFQKRLGHRTMLATPLLREGVSIGAILIRRLEVRPFTDRQIKLLETFADQAVIAIENVRLFKELQERNAELREALEHQTATAEVLGIISRSPTDVQPVLDAIVESAARVCGIDDVHLRLRAGNVMISRAHFGPIHHGPAEVSIDAPLFRWVRERGTLHIPDVCAQNKIQLIDPGPLRTFLTVPLRQQEEVIGALVARRTEVRPFTPAQIKLLETFADQAVIAIENVRLFQELKESLEQQTATSQILGVIASSPTDIQPVLDAVAESAARLCDALDAAIYRVDGRIVKPVAHHGPVPFGRAHRPLARGLPVGRAILDRDTVHIYDLAEAIETEFPDAKPLQQQVGTRTTLVTPLLREGVAIGAILIRRTEVRPFTEKQIALLKTFADQAVIAIENVRLFKELQERTRELVESVEEMKALSEVGQAVSSSLELETVLETIVSRAVDLTGTDCGVIYEYDEATQEFNLRA